MQNKPRIKCFFILNSAMQLKKRCFLFERNRLHLGRMPANIPDYPSILTRLRLWNTSDCSADAFLSADIFRTCCREQKISVSPGGCETKVEEVCATQGPLAFDISACVSRAGTKQSESHDLEFSAQINKAFIYMY